MANPAQAALKTAIGDYPHTRALRDGRVVSDLLKLEFAAIAPVNRAFAPMVREGRFDVCELAIATFLQARAYGKPVVMLPVVLAARFQEAALLCLAGSGMAGPADLGGRRVGVRAYSQTTGMWLRGILAGDFAVPASSIHWVTFEDAHVAEYADPPFAIRAAPGADMLAMLRVGELDAVIVGNEVPGGTEFRTLFPDPVAAGAAFMQKHGFVPVNHVLTVSGALALERPDLVAELVRMFRAAAALAEADSQLYPGERAGLELAAGEAMRFCRAQGLLPDGFALASGDTG